MDICYIVTGVTHPRLQYIVDWLMTEQLALRCLCVPSVTDVPQGEICLHYTPQDPGSGVWIRCSSFFSTEGITPAVVSGMASVHEEVIEGLERVRSGIALSLLSDRVVLPDIFALGFFLLSRYEEYLPFQPDRYGRFSSGQSLSARMGCTHRALLDECVLWLRDVLLSVFPGRHIARQGNFCLQSTLDVDQAWAYRYKGWRAVAGRLVAGDVVGAWQAVGVLAGRLQDPFDTFERIRVLHASRGLLCHIFVLVAARKTALDKNHSPDMGPFRGRVRQWSEWANVGVHPSSLTQDNTDELRLERDVLSAMTGRAVNSSRQHFLLMQFPETYRYLSHAGLQHDYSMGWADSPGYRAGTSFSFRWYDLPADTVSSMRIHPFQIMDVMLKNYLHLDVDTACSVSASLKAYAESIDAPLSFIWHNSSLDERGEWSGWHRVYETLLGPEIQ